MTDGRKCAGWVAVSALALVSACKPQASGPAPVRPYPAPELASTGDMVAKLDDAKITGDEFTKRLVGQGPSAIDRMSDPARRKQFLEEQVRFELLAREAWAKGFQDQPDMIAELKKAIVQKYLRTVLDERVDSLPISETDLAATYQANHAEYNKPATIRLSQIVRRVNNDGDRKKAHALLERLKAEILAAEKKNKPTAFGEAARDNSEDEGTRTGAGELQFMNKEELTGKYGKEVADMMFEHAAVGDMVIADASDATVLFKKTGLRNAVVRTLEMVKPQLRARVQRDRRNMAFDALFAELEKKHGVTYDLDALNRIPLGNQGKIGTSTRAP